MEILERLKEGAPDWLEIKPFEGGVACAETRVTRTVFWRPHKKEVEYEVSGPSDHIAPVSGLLSLLPRGQPGMSPRWSGSVSHSTKKKSKQKRGVKAKDRQAMDDELVQRELELIPEDGFRLHLPGERKSFWELDKNTISITNIYAYRPEGQQRVAKRLLFHPLPDTDHKDSRGHCGYGESNLEALDNLFLKLKRRPSDDIRECLLARKDGDLGRIGGTPREAIESHPDLDDDARIEQDEEGLFWVEGIQLTDIIEDWYDSRGKTQIRHPRC